MITVVPSPCKSKEYVKSGMGNVVPGILMGLFLNEKAKHPCYCLDIHFNSDNRKRFRKLWGKPHFHYLGEVRFHSWRFKVTHNGQDYFYYVLTAQELGTCFERNGELKYDEPIQDVDKEFALWMEKQLLSLKD